MIDHNGDEALELYERAHRKYARDYPEGDYPSAGGDIETIGDREFVVLFNSLRTLAIYEIRAERLLDAPEDDVATLMERDEQQRLPRSQR